MDLTFTPAQEETLAKIASEKNVSVTTLLTDAAAHVLQLNERHWESIDRAIAQADRGEFIEDEEMEARIERMLARS